MYMPLKYGGIRVDVVEKHDPVCKCAGNAENFPTWFLLFVM